MLITLVYAGLGMVPDAWQIVWAWRFVSKIREYLDVRTRGGSKTMDMMICSIFILISEPGTEGGWYAGASKQLKRAMKYARRLKAKTWMGLYFTIEAEEITNMPLVITPEESTMFVTIHGTSGDRAALQVYDEEGKARKVDIKRSMEEASGNKFGAVGIPRERHGTTLGLDTPAEDVYNRLFPLGLVFKRLPKDCSWIDPVEVELEMKKHPRWFNNMEYLCEPDAPGGRIIKQFDTYEGTPYEAYPDVSCRGGIDWNPSVGHAGCVKFTRDNQEDWIVDEISTTDLQKLAKFIVYWEYFHECVFTYESQGEKVLSKAPQLKVMPCYIINEEKVYSKGEWEIAGRPQAKVVYPQLKFHERWTGAIQLDRVSWIESRSDDGLIHVHLGCTEFQRQANKWHYDDQQKNGLPASNQEDHEMDAYAHSGHGQVKIQLDTSPARGGG